jgi:hypothetical protein
MSNDRRLETSLCICEIKSHGNARAGYNRYAEKADREIYQCFTAHFCAAATNASKRRARTKIVATIPRLPPAGVHQAAACRPN